MALPRLKPLSIAAIITRLIARLIRKWPWALLAVCLLSPITPHLRWDYRYRQSNPDILFDCRYLGVRGFVKKHRTGDCPFVAFMNTNN